MDERVLPGEAPGAYVQRLALAKAAAVARVDALSLGADTAVVLDDRILGKPVGRDQALSMLAALSGRCHEVFTGIAAVRGPRGADGWAFCAARWVVTEVRFRVVEPWEAEAYWATREGADKAGGYGIQGIGGIFAESIRGSYSGVVGLPLAETERLLREGGVDTWRGRMAERDSAGRTQSERTDG